MNITRHKFAGLAAPLLLLSAYQVGLAAGVEITAPRAGWRDSSSEKVKFTQTVNYPASSVNTQEDQSEYAVIKGKISVAGKNAAESANTQPYLLIANGISMPLLVSGDSFSRPFIFSPGSNSVEVRSPDHGSRARMQFYETNTAMLQARLSVLLSWDTDQTDLDLHVISPDGKHCWYGERVMDNGGALDVDVTTGYGPEIYSTPAPVKGTYLVYVNYYGSGPRSDLTVAQVTVVTNQNTPDEKKETIIAPMRVPGELVHAHSFVVP